MRTFQNNSKHNFSNTCAPNLPDKKSETWLKLHQERQFFLILNSYFEKMLNANFILSLRFLNETMVIWTRITAAKEKMVQK